MKTYKGLRGPDGCQVTVDDRRLAAKFELLPVNEAEFEWGYDGSGPNQLAFAMLADHFDSETKALASYKLFRDRVISTIQNDSWTLSTDDIERSLQESVDVPMTLNELLNKVRGRSS